MLLTKQFDDPQGHVSKLVFEDDKTDAIAEAVVYQYENRGVVCFSVQSGCPVGCTFCGTGKRYIRNLSIDEIYQQIAIGRNMIKDKEKQQFMSMSMGEPMLNWYRLWTAALMLYDLDPNAHLYVSTVGIYRPQVLHEFLEVGQRYKNFGLQFSLHECDENKRRELLGGYMNLMSLNDMKYYARLWRYVTGKPVYFNYICKDTPNKETIDNIYKITKGQHLTLSVLCNTTDFAKGDPAPAMAFSEMMLDRHPDQDVTVFDPAGQDTIGGGCGQLLYVQEELRSR